MTAKPHNCKFNPSPFAGHRWIVGASVFLMSGCEKEHRTSADSGGELGKVPLKIEYPVEGLAFTPKPLPRWPGLVPSPKQAPVFLVPMGTVLLSKGKKVSSSDSKPIIGSLKMITDGVRRVGAGYYVELMEGTQWVQIDLEKSAELHAIVVWHDYDGDFAYRGVVIQISDDPKFQAGVVTVYNNDYDNTLKFGKGFDPPYQESGFGLIADAKGTKGRYVRLYSSGSSVSDYNCYTEVSVFGMPQVMEAKP